MTGGWQGILIQGSNGNLIQGNYVGTDAAGTAAVGNFGAGIELNSGAQNNVVAGNVISGNGKDGVVLWSATANVLRSNLIGTNAAGTLALGNADFGIWITNASGNTIGGASGTDGNVISGNGLDGIAISANSNDNLVQGNRIGTNAAGTAAIPNAFAGIWISDSSRNTIGGTVANAGNVISGNLTSGVEIEGNGSTQNAILGNLIYANAGGLGIDLGANGVTANDSNDNDNGPNDLQNFPVLAGGSYNGTTLTVTGSLTSKSGTYRIEFFASGTADPSGYGEGQRYLGTLAAPLVLSGTGTQSFTFTQAVVLNPGEVITATATDIGSGNTSEFSAALYSVTGTVYEDVNGNGSVLDDGQGRGGVDVRLFLDTNQNNNPDSTDGPAVASAVTNAAGGYWLFAPGASPNLVNGRSFVVVDSRDITPTAGYAASGFIGPTAADDVWADQTYAFANAIGANSVQAVWHNGTYQFQTSAGAFYGGLIAGRSDDGLTLNVAGATPGAEHIQRLTISAGSAGLTGVDSGFSFNAVINNRGDNTDDSAAGDQMQQGTLRQFILNANAIANLNVANFSINFPGGGGLQTINVAGAALPTIFGPTVLDAAATQEGFTGTPIIDLNGAGAGAGAHGLTIAGGGSTVRGFVIRDFSSRGISIVGGGGNVIAGNYVGTDAGGMLDRGNGFSGIFIENSAGNTIGGPAAADRNVISGNNLDGVSINGPGSTGNRVLGNFIGVNAAGTAALGNGEAGVDIDSGARNNIVGGVGAGNVISGNTQNGVEIDGVGTTGNVVLGNYVGLNAAGNIAIANQLSGIAVTGAAGNTIGGTAGGAGNVASGNMRDGIALVSANGNLVQGNYVGTDQSGNFAVANHEDGVYVLDGSSNTIGGAASGAANLLSGNLWHGLELRGAATDNVVEGNFAGLNAAGNVAIANSLSGILLNGASGNTIGGTAVGAGNVLSGNFQDGITGFGASDSLIQGNYVGTDWTGSFAIGNREDGIYLQDGSNNTVGGASLAAGNLLSGNLWSGLTFWGAGSGNVAQGNYIGTDAFGAAPLGNGRAGVYVGTTGAATIGGTAAAESNVIAYNGWDGVALMAGTGHSVLGNSIHSNAEQAIDINDDGITLNDSGDADFGTNALQNFPVVASAVTTGPQLVIVGALNSTPGTNFRVEFFANSGDGEGERYLGFVNVTTDAGGNVPLNFTLPVTVAAGEFITASATRADATFTSFFETSELGPSAVVVPANQLSGTLRHDVNGNANVADDGGAVFANAVNAVRLYLDDGDGAIDGGDFFVTTASTDAAGGYLFTNLGTGTYWVVADSKALGGPGVWAEQTYGAAGAAQGAGFSAGGALYGGRNATLSDDATALVTAEHVIGRSLAAGSAANVDFGFSFNVVTNTLGGDFTDHDAGSPRTIQGSLRQFIQNANANATFDASMRFVPAEATNDAGGGGNWWQIVVTNALPSITRAGTKIDGTAYSFLDGTTVVNPNAGFLGTGGTVGVDNLALAQVARPELEIQDGLAGTSSGNGLDVDANDVAIRNLAIWGFWNPTLTQGGEIIVDANVLGTTIENNVIGATATGADPGAERGAAHGVAAGAAVAGPDGGAVRNNLIAFHGLAGIDLRGVIGNAATGWLIEGNEIRGNGVLNNQYDGVNVVTNVAGLVIRGNLVEGNQGPGLDLFNNVSGTIENNTVRNNSLAGGPEQFQISVTDPSAADVTIDRNVVGGTAGPGVTVRTSAAGSNVYGGQVQITRNSIFPNAGLGIDLDNTLLAPYDGDGVTPNDAGDGDAGPNDRQNFPVLTGASVNGGTVTINGSFNGAASTTFRIEFFASATGDASGHGEGQRYLGMAMVSTDPSGNASFSAPLAAAVAIGETVTATATSVATNATSEFAQNVLASAPRSISGMTRYDVNGNGLADDGLAFFTGATVRLYRDDGDNVIDAGDTLSGTTTVQPDGTYTFTGLTDATYYVAIDSKTLLFPASAIWAEQTYGVAGAASGAGFLGAAGMLFGGRSAAVSDDASTLTTSEHVTRVILSGADAVGIDAGFALNAITSNRDGDDDGALSGRTVQGSLRQFIQNSNAIGGTQSADFSIGGGGFQSIALASALPVITDAVILDATTQELFGSTPLIELNGSGVATLNDGFQISASGVTVRGFVINRFLGDGIHLDGSNSIIAGNWIGLDSTGTVALGNGSPGVHVLGANNVIGGTGPNDRNVISGNAAEGIRIDGAGATGNLVQGNYIGTDRTGTLDRGNAGDGISIQANASGNTIGGTAVGARNVIAGNNDDGIEITGSSSGNVIAGNYIGLDASGTVALGNSAQGIDVSGSGQHDRRDRPERPERDLREQQPRRDAHRRRDGQPRPRQLHRHRR